MKSVLSPESEAKRVRIAKAHNRLVIVLLISMILFLFIFIWIVPHGLSKPSRIEAVVGSFLIIAALEAYGIYRIIKHDEELCRQLGFMCPHCGKPLYESRSFINITGRCPKCRGNVIG